MSATQKTLSALAHDVAEHGKVTVYAKEVLSRRGVSMKAWAQAVAKGLDLHKRLAAGEKYGDLVLRSEPTAPQPTVQVALWLPLLPNRLYPFGGRSESEMAYITRLDEQTVYYRKHNAKGADAQMPKSHFHALVKTGVASEIKSLERRAGYMSEADHTASPWVREYMQHYRNLLAGTNTMPQED